MVNTLQQQVQLRLLEKQRELQESILKQQEELLKIHNQLKVTSELGSTLHLVQVKSKDEQLQENSSATTYCESLVL